MLCCSSCSLPIQGLQIPKGVWCSILFDKTMHASGKEPECTVCLQPWSGHPRGKHIPKDCKFCHQQVQGNLVEDELEQQDDGDVHTRLSCITLENQAIKAQLSQLTELVHQLLPQSSQSAAQSREDQAASTPAALEPSQLVTTTILTEGLPPPTWVQPEEPEGAPGPLQLLPFTHVGQHPVQCHGSPSAAAPGQAAGPSSTPGASTCQPWAFPASTGVPVSPVTKGLPPAQVPAPLRGKIQWGEYVDLSELLVYDFQYRYSGLDDSQALEVIDGKLSLAPKHKAGHLLNLQLWLRAWHLYEDTVLSFYIHRYMELSHYCRHISDLDQCFHWAAILSYNAQFWHKCMLHNLPFSTFDQQLYVTILDATVAKAMACRCFHCQCFNHKVIDYPFPPGALLEKEAMAKKTVQSQQGWGIFCHQQQHSSSKGSSPQLLAIYHQGREICMKYQSASCSLPNCRRAHVCRHCKQDHPATECHPAGPITPQSR